MKIIRSITEYYTEIGLPPPKYPSFHVGRHENNMPVIKKVQPPVKHELYSISLTSKHNGELEINFNRVKFQLFIISPFKVIRWDITGQQITGVYIIFDREFIQSNILWKNFLVDFPYFRQGNLALGNIPQSLINTINGYFENIYKEYYTPGAEQFDLIRSYVHTVLLLLKRHFDNSEVEKTPPLLNNALLADFEGLLLATLTGPGFNPGFRKPSFYAAKLNLHVNYLNSIIKQLTGKTTSAFIQDHIVHQAGLLIRQTALPVKDIAARFHFSQATHFILFFKTHTGLTPKQFRSDSSLPA